MKKRIAALICLTVLLAVVLCPLYTGAVTPLDPDAEASLALHYQKDGQAFPGLSISIYRVAEAFPDGTFALIAPFISYPVNIHGITQQEQWQNTAATLNSYIVANQLAPTRTGVTNDAGIAAFGQLETGLYLVCEVIGENNTGTYVFNQFMVYLPTPQPDGSYNYAVEANPKCVSFVPKTEYRVTKLWQDAGHQTDRPEQVAIDIYRDGVLQETQILSPSNNWSYTWYVSADDQSKWTVTEQSVPEGYTVTVQENGSYFSLINTHKSNEDVPDIPVTGDSFNPLPWVLALCISGIILILLAIYSRRR